MDPLRELAATQHGVVSREQCRALGIGAGRLESRLHREDWQRVSPRVLRVVGAPRTALQDVMAAVLDGGAAAVASHRTAAALWRLPGFALVPVDVSRLRATDGHGGRLGRVHQPRSLPPHHCTVVNGIPVTTPARTIFDLAGALGPSRTERALDNALAKSPALLAVLHRMLAELAERGRTGITLMRGLLAARPAGYMPPASGLEARVIRLLDDAGIRTCRQVDLGGDDWIGRVDLVVEGTNLVIEVDSARYHASLSDRRRDEARDAALAVLGHVVLRLAEEDVWARPAEIVRRVRTALARSGTRFAA